MAPLNWEIWLASSITSPSSSSGGTTRLTSPHSKATSAEIGSAVSSISIARLRPMARVKGTIGVEQNKPMRTPGVAKELRSEATAKSHAATNWQPAAVATPSTLAMTG